MDYLKDMIPDTVALTQNSWTKVANASPRKYLMLNNTTGTANRVTFGDSPWCVRFDGTNDYVNLDAAGTGLLADSDLVAATSGTVKADIKWNSAGTGERVIFSWSNADGTDQLIVGIDNANKLFASALIDGAAVWTVTATAALVAGKWYTIKVAHYGTSPKIYVNNEEVPQAQSVTEGVDLTVWFADVTAAVASLGQKIDSSAGASFWYGDLRQVEIYTGRSSLNTRETILILRGTEGTGTAIADTSGNGYSAAFAADTAAPTWADYRYGFTLANGANAWYDTAVPQQAVWVYTTAESTALEVTEGW